MFFSLGGTVANDEELKPKDGQVVQEFHLFTGVSKISYN